MNADLYPIFREAQHEFMQYKGGLVGVRASPGSGKTWLLAQLAAVTAAKLTEKDLQAGREILVVTFSNSAAAALRNQIHAALRSYDIPTAIIGVRVRTLHALALDIISESPELFGLTPDFRLIEERIAYHIRRTAVLGNLSSHPELDTLLDPALRAQSQRLESLKTDLWPTLLHRVAERFIQTCKSNWLSPSDYKLRILGEQYPLIAFLVSVYHDYQFALLAEQAVDYDDLIVLACATLKQDAKLLRKLQMRWKWCFEDEAQDSTSSQAVMLRLITGGKNWVRVGDPNQAINTSFTSANPDSFRQFCAESGVKNIHLSQSGRSARSILDLANTLLKWTRQHHPNRDLRTAFDDMVIQPTYLGDPDPTPPTADSNIHIHITPAADITPDQAQQMVMNSLLRWLPDHADQTVAILVPENRQGYTISSSLQRAGLTFDERLQMPIHARQTLSVLRAALHFLANPLDADSLANLYRLIAQDAPLSSEIARRLSRFRDTEGLLYPTPSTDPLANHFQSFGADAMSHLIQFRSRLQIWLEADHLPIELRLWQIAQDTFTDDESSLIVEEIARFIHVFQRRQPHSGLVEIVTELDTIAANNARFLRSADAEPFTPRPGIPTVATIHASKGLEWDRVYVLGINDRAFPSASAEDVYVADRWFVENHFNLEAEAQAAIAATTTGQEYSMGEATQQARRDFAAERLRLLYVAITRARHELVLLWDMGTAWRSGSKPAKPALPLIALHEYLEGMLHLE